MNELSVLLLSAISLGFIHTILGPDHYLPFIVIGRARSWSQTKTLWVTFVSGIGHVGSSVVIGIVGIGLGQSLQYLEGIESTRGDIAAWLIILFGLGYTIYGIIRFNKGHHHFPQEGENDKKSYKELTPWILFTVFVFGPCEVLIPMLIFPAAQNSFVEIGLVSLVFGIGTISTMLVMVYLGYKGLKQLKHKHIHKYMHIMAGVVILLAGIGIKFLGL